MNISWFLTQFPSTSFFSMMNFPGSPATIHSSDSFPSLHIQGPFSPFCLVHLFLHFPSLSIARQGPSWYSISLFTAFPSAYETTYDRCSFLQLLPIHLWFTFNPRLFEFKDSHSPISPLMAHRASILTRVQSWIPSFTWKTLYLLQSWVLYVLPTPETSGCFAFDTFPHTSSSFPNMTVFRELQSVNEWETVVHFPLCLWEQSKQIYSQMRKSKWRQKQNKQHLVSWEQVPTFVVLLHVLLRGQWDIHPCVHAATWGHHHQWDIL